MKKTQFYHSIPQHRQRRLDKHFKAVTRIWLFLSLDWQVVLRPFICHVFDLFLIDVYMCVRACVCVCVCVCVFTWGYEGVGIWGRGLCVCVCCGMVWVSKGWGLGGVGLRKGSLSRGCVWVCVCVCVYVDHTSVAASNRGEWSFLSPDKVSRKQILLVFAPPGDDKHINASRLSSCSASLFSLSHQDSSFVPVNKVERPIVWLFWFICLCKLFGYGGPPGTKHI